jgi:hypothetical protein
MGKGKNLIFLMVDHVDAYLYFLRNNIYATK